MNTLSNSRISWRLLIVLTLAFAGFAIFQGRVFIFGPAVMETGDFAANALLIIDARSFSDIYGNYSRWGFNHPGPFFFYWYALGELLFRDILHIVASPHQAHVLAGILLQSALLATAITLIVAGTGRKLIAPVVFTVAAVILLNAGNVISSIWMPHVLLAPYIVLIVSSAMVAMGALRLLPLTVLMVCILCHGHVAQPLMSVPLLLAALAVHARSQRSLGLTWAEICRTVGRPALLSAAIIAIFLVPIVIDLTRCPDCNAKRILGYMAQHASEQPKWRQAVNSIAAFFVFEHNPEFLSESRHVPWFTKRVLVMLSCIAITSLVIFFGAHRRNDNASAFLRTCIGFCLFSLLLSCVWARRITGPLYEFNSYFVYGIVFLIATCLASWLALLTGKLADNRQWVAAGWGLAVLITSCLPRLPVFSANNVVVDVTPEADNSYKGRLALLNRNENEDWAGMTALATWTYRSGGNYASPRDWAYVFGWNHAFNPAVARAAGDRMDIWEPGHSREDLAGGRFTPSAYCRISAASRDPNFGDEPVSLNGAREACTMTAFGLGKIDADPSTWITSPSVFLQMRGRHVVSEATIRLLVDPYLGGGRLSSQRILVRVNGIEVAPLVYPARGIQETSIPADIWNKRDIQTIELSFPDATSPFSLGASSDPRALSVRIQGLGIHYK